LPHTVAVEELEVLVPFDDVWTVLHGPASRTGRFGGTTCLRIGAAFS
jgi:hypothetical protein